MTTPKFWHKMANIKATDKPGYADAIIAPAHEPAAIEPEARIT